MRWIYISPHLDDAVLSCGGLIWEQARKGEQVEIWTVCAGEPPDGPLSPLAEALHTEWGTGRDTVARRREEDIAACRAVGALHRHLAIPDCIYRREKDGNLVYADGNIFCDIHPSDRPLIETVRAFLSAVLKPGDTLVCPLTIGGHVDHRLTRAAVESLERSVLYYADVPYVWDHPSTLAESIHELQSGVYPVSESGLKAWQEGIAAYASHIGMLFENLERMREVIHSYWKEDLGIRLWRAG